MISFIINHFVDFINAFSSIVAGASVLTAMTPSPKDDNVVAKVKNVLNVCALNIGNAKVA